jgi:4-diphosphocytidyl-2-C-methyl-D-erythritol kinase
MIFHRAPAKLNLFLEVLGKRPDGYHELETLMVAVNLCDTLSCRDDPAGRLTLACSDPGLPTGPENLVHRAAELLRASSEGAGARGASIELTKEIPAEAGLGGGSSDAAATLIALDRLWNLQTPPSRLEALAGMLGSDVPFFLRPPAAICRGRGERVEPITLPSPLHFVLVCPPIGSSTAAVYRHAVVPERPRSVRPVLDALDDPAALGPELFNRLEPIAIRRAPDLAHVRNALHDLQSGPGLVTGHLMSGSGSAFFGLARDAEAARTAAAHLATKGLGQVRHVVATDLETSPA